MDVEKLSVEIQKFIDEKECRVLPSVRTFSVLFDISPVSVLKALNILKNQGIIEITPRRRARVIKYCKNRNGVISSNENKNFYSKLKEVILSGKIRPGELLPKISYFCLQEHVAPKTVISAYRMAIKEGYAYKISRKYFAGTPLPKVIHGSKSLKPSILILTSETHSWSGMAESKRSSPFCYEFLDQAIKQDIHLKEIRIPLKSGWDKIREVLQHISQDQSSHILGFLIAFKWEFEDDFFNFIKHISQYGKPIIWFDTADQKYPLTFKSNIRDSVLRCHYDENLVVETALQYLYHNGHKKVCYIPTSNSYWQKKRWESIYNSQVISNEMISITNTEYFTIQDWENFNQNNIIHRIDQMKKLSLTSSRFIFEFISNKKIVLNSLLDKVMFEKLQEYPSYGNIVAFAILDMQEKLNSIFEMRERKMFWASFYLAPSLLNGTTAIIAPNDDMCRRYHIEWLSALGVKVPSEMSVISFDHVFRWSFYPLTTVNYQFQSLAFKAFHAILGDIPIKADSHGNIPISPVIIDNGSVADLNINI